MSARQPTVPPTAYGVDGCKDGKWFYFALARSGKPDWNITDTIEQLVARAHDLDRICVDIPIGLPDGPAERPCDREARRKLGQPLGTTVFPAPVRAALHAKTWEQANTTQREKAGRGMTMQTFAILPRIREVDCLLKRCEKARRIVREVHPEICFWALAGGRPMLYSKRTGAGFLERLKLLKRCRPSAEREFGEVRATFPHRALADDDILDAMVAAVTASADEKALESLPEDPEHEIQDRCGRRMQMLLRKPPC